MHERTRGLCRLVLPAILVVLPLGQFRELVQRIDAADPNDGAAQARQGVEGPRLASAISQPPLPEGTGRVTVPNCQVSLVEEAELPAQESGTLEELLVREGSQVHVGELLGRVNDRVAHLQQKAAEAQYRAAKEKSENDINVRYAVAAAGVAEASYESAVEANRRVPNAIAMNEIRRLKLEAERTKLQIEQAQLEQKLLGDDLAGKAVDLENAQEGVRRRQIFAPCDGVIVEVRRHVGEWLNPGQTVLKIIRMDHMRVEAFLGSSKFDPTELAGRPVHVDVDLGGGRRQAVAGRIVFVSPLGQAGEYRIYAEVDNVQQDNHWLLKAGQTAVMTVE